MNTELAISQRMVSVELHSSAAAHSQFPVWGTKVAHFA